MIRFDLGGQLSEPDEITARILVILESGQACRTPQGTPHHGGKVGPGSVVGAASLLSGAPCENDRR